MMVGWLGLQGRVARMFATHRVTSGMFAPKKGHLVPYFLFLLRLLLLCLCGMRTADRASIGREGILSLEIQLK
jgi:hypothetical protein